MVTSVDSYIAKGTKGVVSATAPRMFWLDAGGQPTEESHKISAGQVLKAGSVLGMVTATHELVLCDPAAGDGSAVPYAILPFDLDTSATGTNAAEIVSVITSSNRKINFRALVAPATWNKYDLQAALSKRGIATGVPISSGAL